MSLVSTIFGLFPFAASLIAIFTWTYILLYNHNIIENYSSRLNVPKSNINQYISDNINKKYNITLIQVDDENTSSSSDDDEVENEKANPISSATTSVYNNKTDAGDPQQQNTYAAMTSTMPMAKTVIGIVFSLVFALSIELIILMMCELLSVFNHNSRLAAFQLTIDSLIILITVVQPFIMISLYMTQQIVPQQCSIFKKLSTLACYAGWFLFLHKFGHLSQHFTPSLKNLHTRSLLERKINEIVIAGITTMAVLSGIGSTFTPHKMLSQSGIFNRLFRSRATADSSKPKQLTEVDLNNLIQSYNHTNLLLNKRKVELDNLLVANGGTVYNRPDTPVSTKSSENVLSHNHKPASTDSSDNHQTLSPLDIDNSTTAPAASAAAVPKRLGGMLHRVQSFASIHMAKSQPVSEEQELTDEIESLRSLRNQVYQDLMKSIYKFIEQREQLRNQNKFFSRILHVSMMLFSVYCVYRIINVVFIRLPYHYLFHTDDLRYVHEKTNVIDIQGEAEDERSSTPSRDALAVTLAKVILSISPGIPLTEDQLVNQIGFILSGSLFLCSFSNVLVTLKSVGKIFPSLTRISLTTKTWLKHLIISELLAIYVISTALLIRTNLPTNLSNQISRILSLSGSSANSITRDAIKEVEFIDLWFDKVFGATCIVTIVVIFLRKLINDDLMTKDNYDEYDEEMMVENSPHIFKTA